MLVCATCGFSAPRLINSECDACHKYRERHDGKTRPARLIDRTSDRRWARAQRTFEREWEQSSGRQSQ